MIPFKYCDKRRILLSLLLCVFASLRLNFFFNFFLNFYFFFSLLLQPLYGDAEQLMRTLLTLEELDREEDVVPTTYNHLLQGGYWNMPSARMGLLGEIGAGVSSVPPYRNANLRLQFLSHLEITGSYRLFCGIPDPILSPHGFGDLSERGLNVKLSLLNPEESQYALPGIAIGCDDVAGTRCFQSQYIVATQLIPAYGLELSIGYGLRRLKGVFGGVLWMPYALMRNFLSDKARTLWRPLVLGAEYDATDYRNPERELHPCGRKVSSRINIGCKYRLWNAIDLSFSYVRGQKFAFACDVVWGVGTHGEWIAKTEDPLPYKVHFVVTLA